MKEDKVNSIRHIMTVITMTLAFMMICLCVVALQVKVVRLDYYGKTVTMKTLATNVQSFLISNNIYIDDNTRVYPSMDDSIEKNMTIKITDNSSAKIDIESMLAEYKPVTVKVLTNEEIIAHEEEYIENPGMYRGVSRITKEGTDGLRKVTYLVKYAGGKEVERKTLEENIIEEAENAVTEVGTNINLATSRESGIVIPCVDDGFVLYDIPLSEDMQQYTYAVCQDYGIQYELLLAVMYVESRYNVNAVGGGNSYGLCQIHYSNTGNLSRAIGVTDLLDPYENIEAGAYMLAMYLGKGMARSSDEYFIEHYGLNCYNMGEGVYVSNCYNNGILERTYSYNVIAARDRLISTGGI